MSENYLGNPNLKRANVPSEFGPNEVSEYLLCQDDPEYFIRNYVKIVNIDKGFIPFEPYDFQVDIIKKTKENRFVICKMPRQSGKTTTIAAMLLWYALFHDEFSIAILAHKLSQAREIMHRIQRAYEALPRWMQMGVVEWNKGNIELENGSKVLASATSSSAIRGGSFNLIYLDEFAFIPNQLADDFFSSVYPTISSGKTSKVLITSTPNGLNMFYKLWTDAEEGRNLYKTVDVHWSDIPGRDDKWRQEQIANTSEEQFRVEFECEFIGSSNTLISGAKLRTLTFKNPKYRKENFDVYEDPQMGSSYVLVVDTSRGAGLDYSAFTVMDVTQVPYKIVAKYRSKDIAPMLYPNVILNAANAYNKAMVLIEINDIGGQVADILHHELEYENILQTSVKGRSGQQVGSGFGSRVQMGVRTTKQVKRIGCSNLKTMVENDQILINDFDIIQELNSFISKGNSYEAEQGTHDDLVMTLVLFAWLSSQKYFKEVTDLDVRAKIQEMNSDMIDEELTPFGIIDDGLSNESSFVDGDGTRWSGSSDNFLL
jgi:hypothetical protein